MKGKFGVAALLFSSMAFAGPVSTPNNVNDTPIISGGGSVSGGGICKAYQTDGTAVNLSGGETLVFYGTGSVRYWYGYLYPSTFGGYLSTKPNYSGPAYVKVKGRNVFDYCGYSCSYLVLGSAIGLFAQNTDSQNDFIAGAGAGGMGYASSSNYFTTADYNASSGGGWQVMGFTNACRSIGDLIDCSVDLAYGGTAACPYSELWFIPLTHYVGPPSTPGFCGSVDPALGGASSISAWYNSYTKDYTSFGTSLTISGGGYSTGSATIYVCQ